MKIAVNTRLLIKDKLEGIGWFTYETLKRITSRHPEHQFYFIFDRNFSEEFIFNENVTPVIAHPQARHPLLWYLYFEYGIPMALHKIKPDLFLSPDGWLSLRTKVKSVNVIHDLNFEHHPEFIKPVVLKYYDRYFRRFAQKAERIATVSEFTKNDIHTLYQIPEENIDVVYNGCNEIFKPVDENQKKEIRQELTGGADYFLFVGLIHKRKNLDNIFKAYDQFKDREHSGKDTKLVIVGDKKWWKGEIEDTYNAMKYRDEVIFLGRLPAEKLSRATGAATALLYPSLFEGFGIPIIEAFNTETAVITSNITSMPEVAGDAALLVNPYSADEIANAMEKIVRDPGLRASLITKGNIRKNDFSWDKTADKLWETIAKILFV